MIVAETIKDIELYLSINPLEEQKKTSTPSPIFSQVKSVQPLLSMMGVAENAKYGADSSAMIENILGHCSDSQLDEMLQEYGTDSDIGQMICRKRATQYVQKICDTEKIPREIEKELKVMKSDNPFYSSVCIYMERIGFETDADFYNSIGMPRQLFGKIRDAKNTLSKKTVLWIIVGLKLNYNQANDLLRKAGYTFRNSDLRDVILSYIFRNTQYDIWNVNDILDHFGLEPFC